MSSISIYHCSLNFRKLQCTSKEVKSIGFIPLYCRTQTCSPQNMKEKKYLYFTDISDGILLFVKGLSEKRILNCILIQMYAELWYLVPFYCLRYMTLSSKEYVTPIYIHATLYKKLLVMYHLLSCTKRFSVVII